MEEVIDSRELQQISEYYSERRKSPTVRSCIEDLDADGLVDLAYDRFGVEVEDSSKLLTHCIMKVMNGTKIPSESSAYQLEWLKARLAELETFQCGGKSDNFPRYSIPLNVGFVSILETPEHLSRLRTDDMTGCTPRLQQPGIVGTIHYPQPINRTAAKVVPKRDNCKPLVFLMNALGAFLCYDHKWRINPGVSISGSVQSAMIYTNHASAMKRAKSEQAVVIALPHTMRIDTKGRILEKTGSSESVIERPIMDFVAFKPTPTKVAS